MEEVRIWLNPETPDFAELESAVSQYLESLESINYTQEKKAPPPGSLIPIDLVTVSYVVSIAANLAKLVAAIIVIYQQIEADSIAKAPGMKPSKNSIVIKARNLELSIPASKKAVREFLRLLEDKPQSHQITKNDQA